MDAADNFALTCSFQPTSYLGVDVKEPTTGSTRLLALSLSVPPTAVMVFIYSLVAYPLRSEDGERGKEE